MSKDPMDDLFADFENGATKQVEPAKAPAKKSKKEDKQYMALILKRVIWTVWYQSFKYECEMVNRHYDRLIHFFEITDGQFIKLGRSEVQNKYYRSEKDQPQ